MRILTILIFTLIAMEAAHAQEQQPEALAAAQWQWDRVQQQDNFSMLGAYDGNFRQATTFGLGFARYRHRGYPWYTSDQRIAGISLRDWYRNIPAWGATHGLSSLGVEVRDVDYLTGILPAESRNIAAWQQPRSGKVGISTSNRASYLVRANAEYHSGERPGGWAYSLYASRAWGRSYVTDGTWNDNTALYGSISRRLGQNNRISLTVMAAPTARATRSASTMEAYALTGNNLYNPAWGEYQGRQRAARVGHSLQPIVMLSHHYSAPSAENAPVFEITTTISARIGSESRTDINWQNAPNPRPDYYRNMPSFMSSPTSADELADLWRNDPSVSQIDWNAMTSLNPYNTPRAHYITESRVRRYGELTLQSLFTRHLSGRTTLYGGVEVMAADNLNYKRLDDLLGADYWLDIDSFAENDEDTRNKTQNNLRNPNRHVRPGEEFGYRYSMQAVVPRLWIGVNHRWRGWDMSLGGSLGASVVRRVGHYEKENFAASESYGPSATLVRPQWMLRAVAGYAIGGRFRTDLTLATQSAAPAPQNSFVDIDYRNATVRDIRNEQINSIELTANYRLPWLRIYAAAFLTTFKDRGEVRQFYDDFNHFFCNYTLSSIDSRHMGLELSAEVQLADQLWLQLAGVLSDNRYTSDPTATEQRQNTGAELPSERVYYRGLHTEGSPQNVAVVSLEFTPRQWIVSMSMNAFSNSYIGITPLRRTLRSFDQALSPEELDATRSQEQFAGGATLDIFMGRTIYMGDKHRLGIYAGVNNLLNRRDIITGGYEASRMRFVGTEPNRRLRPLDSKYYYAQGINFYLTASWRF